MTSNLKLNRNQLASFLETYEQIKAFEDLFLNSDSLMSSGGLIDALKLAIGVEANTPCDYVPDDGMAPPPQQQGSTTIVQSDFIPITSPVDVIDGDLTVKGDLILPVSDENGIKIDPKDPSFGWRDIIGALIPRATGVGKPTIEVFRTSVNNYAFAAGDDIDFTYHIPHDYVSGTNLFVHLHWGHNGTAISGNFVFDFSFTYSKGHNQEIFPAVKTVTGTYATVNIATTPRYSHRLTEVQLSITGGSATQLDSDRLEPDGVILASVKATTIPTITGGSPNKVFVFFSNIHYQSTNIGTKQKASPFYQ